MKYSAELIIYIIIAIPAFCTIVIMAMNIYHNYKRIKAEKKEEAEEYYAHLTEEHWQDRLERT